MVDTAAAIRADLVDSLSTLNFQLSSNLTDSTNNTRDLLADSTSQLRTELQTANSQQLNALSDTATAIRSSLSTLDSQLSTNLADTSSTLRGLINNVSAASGNGLVDTAAAIRADLVDSLSTLDFQLSSNLADTAAQLRATSLQNLSDTATAIRADIAALSFTTDTLPVIKDADGNTRVEINTSDQINFVQQNITYWRMNEATLTSLNSGNSVFLGEEAGLNDDYSNNQNSFVGYRSGRGTTTGNQNTALGSSALFSNKVGTKNTAIGYAAGWSLIGSNNVAIGSDALSQDTTGSNNVAIGVSTMILHKNGSNNTAIGNQALRFNETGSGNIAIGSFAAYNELGSNKLYIENSNSTTPLIYGNFASDSIKIFGSLSVGNEFTFPTTDGTNGQVLTTDGSCNVTFQTPAAGSDDQTLTLNNSRTLTIEDGNTVDLRSLSDSAISANIDSSAAIRASLSTLNFRLTFPILLHNYALPRYKTYQIQPQQ